MFRPTPATLWRRDKSAGGSSALDIANQQQDICASPDPVQRCNGRIREGTMELSEASQNNREGGEFPGVLRLPDD